MQSIVLVLSLGLAKDSHYIECLPSQAGDRGVANLVFCVGGPYGHSNEVRNRANKTIKLSDMVLNHQVSKVAVSYALDIAAYALPNIYSKPRITKKVLEKGQALEKTQPSKSFFLF